MKSVVPNATEVLILILKHGKVYMVQLYVIKFSVSGRISAVFVRYSVFLQQ